MATKVRLRQIRRGDSLNDQLYANQIQGIGGTAADQDAFQDGLLSQLKRVIWGNVAGNWDADFVGGGIKSLYDLTNSGGGSGGSSESTFDATCLSTDLAGDLVCISGPDNGLVAQVTLADVTDESKMPAVGIIASKSSDTACTVQRLGRVNLVNVGLTNLVAGQRYFVGLDGKPSTTPPDPSQSPSGYIFVQAIGVGMGSETIDIRPECWMVKLKTGSSATGDVPVVFPASGSVISTSPFTCPAGAAVGDLVYLSAADTVDLALASAMATMPAFGVIQRKPDSTHCYVQFAGEVGGYSGLVANTAYYVDTAQPGKLSSVAPATSGQVLQKVGVARNSTTLLLSVDVTDYFVM